MAYAPTNEHGVAVLFGLLAPRLGFRIECVQAACPDCWAVRDGQECRIEFEFRASDFEVHGHSPEDVDLVICWDNDWEFRQDKYRKLEIRSLKKYLGVPPRVFAVGCDEQTRGNDLQQEHVEWSVAKNTQVDDLIVMYRQNYPNSEIRDLWKVVGPFNDYGGEDKFRYQAWIECIARLNKPVTYEDLKRDPATRGLAIVKKKFQGKTDVTDDWQAFCQKIVSLNPTTEAVLRGYAWWQ